MLALNTKKTFLTIFVIVLLLLYVYIIIIGKENFYLRHTIKSTAHNNTLQRTGIRLEIDVTENTTISAVSAISTNYVNSAAQDNATIMPYSLTSQDTSAGSVIYRNGVAIASFTPNEVITSTVVTSTVDASTKGLASTLPISTVEFTSATEFTSTVGMKLIMNVTAAASNFDRISTTKVTASGGASSLSFTPAVNTSALELTSAAVVTNTASTTFAVSVTSASRTSNFDHTSPTAVTSSIFRLTSGRSATEAHTSDTNNFIVNNPRCKIPKLDPLHPSVKKFIKLLPDLKCPGLSYITLQGNILRINASKNVNCFVQSIQRISDNYSKLGDPVSLKNGSMLITNEFVKVACKNESNDTVFYQFYPFVLRKENVDKRIQNFRQKESPPKSEQFQIIMLGLDSASKNQFLRHMGKTFDFMKQKLTFAEIHGYNKIGRNTFPNILPMLTGKLETEVPDMSKHSADVLPIIWKEFMNNGYRTQYNEDQPALSAFNYARKGFTEQPVDYYLRPWSVAVEPYTREWKRGCYNEKVEADVILKYMEDLFDIFPQDPLFAFTFFTRLSHGSLNELGYHDKPIRDFFERMYIKGHFNTTFMFFFGDHGYRFGTIRSTYVGRVEEKLPFMFVIVPPWFPTKYPQMFKNLKTNERRLATPLDIYATLKNLLHFDGEGFEIEGSHRSISLLKHPLPINRTCKDAFIKNQWCACLVKNEPLALDDDRVNSSAAEIVKTINSITKEYRSQCAELSLASILNASKHDVVLGESYEHVGFSNILVAVQVSPSQGIFEGTVWFDGNTSYTADNAIERMNLYKNQSACVNQNVLKQYCFCKT